MDSVSYRHIAPRVWKPEQRYLDMKPNVNGGASPIAVNDRFFAVPWATRSNLSIQICLDCLRSNPLAISVCSSGGSVGIFVQGKYGKNPQPKLIRGHSAPVTTMKFSPLNETVLATGSRESTVKIWKIPDAGLASDLQNADASLDADSKRISAISFHPSVSNLLLTSGGDFKSKIWDIESSSKGPILELESQKDILNSCEWNYSSTILTAWKDNQLRVFDIRGGKSPTIAITPHESTKGFSTIWLGLSDRNGNLSSMPVEFLFGTVGWSKTSERQLNVWDMRSTSNSLFSTAIDVSSSNLTPSYDPGTGLLYLQEKGNRIYVYEMNYSSSNVATQVCKFQAPFTFSGSAIVPKRVMDIKQTEVARFMVIGTDFADTVSFSVPRKDMTLFHEDLFPPVFSGITKTTASTWLSSKDVPPMLISLKPSGMRSVYEVSEEEGGRSRTKDELKMGSSAISAGSSASTAANSAHVEILPSEIKEGIMELGDVGMLWTSWNPVYATIKSHALCLFESKDSASVLRSVEYSQLQEIRIFVEEPLEMALLIVGQQKPIKLRLRSTPERDLWMRCLRDAANVWKSNMNERIASAQNASNQAGQASSSDSVQNSPASKSGNAGLMLEMNGWVSKYTEGFFFNTWQRNYARVSSLDYVLRMFASDSNMEVKEELHLDKVSSVYEASHLEGFSNYFNLITSTRTWVLQAANPTEMHAWIRTLKSIMKQAKSKKNEGKQASSSTTLSNESSSSNEDEDTEDNAVVEGWISTKTGIWSLWSRVWCTAAGNDMLFFSKPTNLEPSSRLQLEKAQSIDFTQGASEPGLEFNIKMLDGKTHYFFCPTQEERDEWLESLRELRVEALATADISTAYGINFQTLMKEKTKDLEDYVAPYMVDPLLLKSGQGNPILICIQGKRRVFATLVPVSKESLAVDAVFVLDTGTHLHQWNGSQASRIQKAKALDLVTKIRTKERGNSITIVVINQGTHSEETATPSQKFYNVLKTDPNSVITQKLNPSNGNSNATAVAAAQEASNVTLFRVGDFKICCIHQGRPPSKDKLHSRYVFVLESGNEIYMWNGKSSSKESKKVGLKLLAKLVEARLKLKKNFIVIMKNVECGETSLWKEKFSDYPSTLPISMNHPTTVGSNIRGRREQPPIDINLMHNEIAPEHTVFDNGSSGNITVWKVEEFEKVRIPTSKIGNFYSGNSFLILYKYMEGNAEKFILYFWQGRDSSVQEKGTSAYLTKDLDDRLHGMAKQIRVVQNQEPLHFLLVFKGIYCIHSGDYQDNQLESSYVSPIVLTGIAEIPVKLARTTSNVSRPTGLVSAISSTAIDTSKNIVRYYDIRGRTEETVHARETVLEDLALNQNHVCVIIDSSKSSAYVWCGSDCNDIEKTYAAKFVGRIWPKFRTIEVNGGKEPVEFWSKFSGLEDRSLPSSSAILNDFPSLPASMSSKQFWPKLYSFSCATGVVVCEQIWTCDQDSLDPRHVNVLDSRSAIWIWFGSQSKVNEQKLAMQAGIDYASLYPWNPPVYVTKTSSEPIAFTSQFHGWSSSKSRLETLGAPDKPIRGSTSSSSTSSPAMVKPVQEVLKDYLREVYAYSELLVEPLPVGVDPKRLEQYLTLDEFESVFKMTRDEYDKMPTWKQDNAKRSVGLF